MEIIYNANEPTNHFGFISIGGVFKYDGDIYLKYGHPTIAINETHNAINLSSNKTREFNYNDKVIPLKAKLLIM